MRGLYTLLIRLFFAGVRLAAAVKPKAHLLVIGQRNTLLTPPEAFEKLKGCYWFHCASLGEFEQGRPLMEALKSIRPDVPLVLTFFSPSGYEIRKNYPLADLVLYLPTDTPPNARWMVGNLRPRSVFFVKYEFWPNFIEEIHRSGAKLYSVSCRFRPGQRFFQWHGGLFRKALSRFDWFFHQDESSMRLLSVIGIADRSSVSGDTRFDRVSHAAIRSLPVPEIEEFKGNSKLLVIGSSWEKEEAAVSELLKRKPDNLKVVIAPHDISEARIAEIEQRFKGHAARFSKGKFGGEHSVLIMDNIGLLGRIYRHADVALVGGGFSGKLHNILEPAAFGIPVVFGSKIKKFPEAEAIVKAGGGYAVQTPNDAAEIILRLLKEPSFAGESGRASVDFVRKSRGATDCITNRIREMENI
jgi:3-deoxy-D-manno-octulosonic-acid transferase